jgi:hypothetical protein
LLLFNLLNKTNTSSILVPGTKNTVCFAVGFTSKLYGINLTIEQLKESGFIEMGKIIVMAVCVDRRYFFC